LDTQVKVEKGTAVVNQHCVKCGGELASPPPGADSPAPVCPRCAVVTTPVPAAPESSVLVSLPPTAANAQDATLNFLTDLVDSLAHILKDWQTSPMPAEARQNMGAAIKHAATVLHDARATLSGGTTESASPVPPPVPAPPVEMRAAPKYELGTDVFFNARHFVTNGHKGDVHPHSYRVQARFSGNEVDKHGMLVGFAEARKSIQQQVERFNNVLLNDMPSFKVHQPTTENIAMVLYIDIQAALKGLPLCLNSVCVWESPTSYVLYTGGACQVTHEK